MDTISNVENATGTGQADTTTGSTAANSIDGGGGADTIDGGSGNDTLDGNTGADTLLGRGGVDTLTGGADSDIFMYEAPSDGENVASGTGAGITDDSVVGFSTGADQFFFDTNDFGGISTGTLTDGVNFSVISEVYDGTNAGTNTEHAAGNDSFIFSTNDLRLVYDPDGSSGGYQIMATLGSGSVATSDVEIFFRLLRSGGSAVSRMRTSLRIARHRQVQAANWRHSASAAERSCLKVAQRLR